MRCITEPVLAFCAAMFREHAIDRKMLEKSILGRCEPELGLNPAVDP